MDTLVSARPSGLRVVFGKMTTRLFIACLVTALLNLLFGQDTTSFSGVQSIPAFDRVFGTPIGKNHSYALSASRASFISSVAFAGKFVGTLTAPFLIERIGHRYAIFICCVISCTAITIECTSSKVVQFVMGRIIVYYAVGLAENCSTTYQAEIVPAAGRGAVVATIQVASALGQIVSAGVNRAYSTSTDRKGWIIPVAVQAVAPVIIFFGTFFIPDSPRWLISKDRKDDAIRSLEKVRPRADVDAGVCKAEADAIQEAVNNKVGKGPWLDLFRGTNLRRTTIATMVFIFQQLTGQAFVSQYSPRFYDALGLGSHAFDYNIASAVVLLVGTIIGMLLVDITGRRVLLIWGGILQTVFLFLVAGLGVVAHPTVSDANGLVAGVILFNCATSGTWAPISYITASEIGTGALREKTMSFSSTVNVVAAWLVSFVVPYLINDILANLGWVFGAISILSTLYAYFFVPELKNRSLEELDELFASHTSARKFKTTKTFGAGHRVAELENLSADQVKGNKRAREEEVEIHEMEVI